MFTPLSGRSVLITGGTRGIGKATARVFLDAGARVVMTGRDARAGAAAAAELAADGGELVFVAGDVSVTADVERMVAEAIERFGGLDVLCANAGVFPRVSLADINERDIDQIFAINVRGTILAVKAAVPALAASGHGRVIITSSITGPMTGQAGWSHYGASKSAQLGFLRTAAIELAGDGITVNAVLPGNIAFTDPSELAPGLMSKVRASVPQQRLGNPEEVAHAVLFLATDEAGYITGQTIVVDGGQTLPEWTLGAP